MARHASAKHHVVIEITEKHLMVPGSQVKYIDRPRFGLGGTFSSSLPTTDWVVPNSIHNPSTRIGMSEKENTMVLFISIEIIVH